MSDGVPAGGGAAPGLRIEYCGQWFTPSPDAAFHIGRDADLTIDDNPYLHRHFLSVSHSAGLWWLSNDGSRIAATVSSGGGGLQAWLAPAARLPLVFGVTTVVFSAGPTTYELAIHSADPAFTAPALPQAGPKPGEATIGAVPLTPSQKALIVALSEPLLRRDGTGPSAVPSSAQAAARLGWPVTKFNRKLDNVCTKLDLVGVRGLRGGPGKLASNRKARLVEYAVASHLVTRADLPLLDDPAVREAPGDDPQGDD